MTAFTPCERFVGADLPECGDEGCGCERPCTVCGYLEGEHDE